MVKVFKRKASMMLILFFFSFFIFLSVDYWLSIVVFVCLVGMVGFGWWISIVVLFVCLVQMVGCLDICGFYGDNVYFNNADEVWKFSIVFEVVNIYEWLRLA